VQFGRQLQEPRKAIAARGESLLTLVI
jgi:hypothetical protein